MNIEQRFWSNLNLDWKTGCWNWLGKNKTKFGYARFLGGKRRILVHRYSYQTFVGVIPTGLQIDHLCRNTSCVNPHHLEAVTAQVNQLRGASIVAINARKTHCPKGHEYSGKNLYISKHNQRHCLKCICDRTRYYRSLKFHA